MLTVPVVPEWLLLEARQDTPLVIETATLVANDSDAEQSALSVAVALSRSLRPAR